jgi:hypothetical protein
MHNSSKNIELLNLLVFDGGGLQMTIILVQVLQQFKVTSIYSKEENFL